MRCRSRTPLWLWTGMLVGACLALPAPVPAFPEQVSVLILLPGQPGLPAASAIASGIRAALLTEWAFRVSIEMEHVDVARFASPEPEEHRLRTMYGSKYRDQRFDVIVAALPEPFQFVLRARDELWPGTPVVVCGVDERSVRDLTPPPGFAVLPTPTCRRRLTVPSSRRSTSRWGGESWAGRSSTSRTSAAMPGRSRHGCYAARRRRRRRCRAARRACYASTAASWRAGDSTSGGCPAAARCSTRSR